MNSSGKTGAYSEAVQHPNATCRSIGVALLQPPKTQQTQVWAQKAAQKGAHFQADSEGLGRPSTFCLGSEEETEKG